MSFFDPDLIQSRTTPSLQRLESNSVLDHLFQGRYSLDGYHCVVLLFHRFYSRMEKQLVQCGMGNLAGPLFYTHLKTPLLEADLDVLEISSHTCDFVQEMEWQDPPSHLLSALGVWFLLERAHFSWGRLNKLLKRRYGLDAATGLAFFTNYGNRFEFFWEDFLLFLQSQVHTPDQAEEFFQAVEATSLKLDEWLTRGFQCCQKEQKTPPTLDIGNRSSRPQPTPKSLQKPPFKSFLPTPKK